MRTELAKRFIMPAGNVTRLCACLERKDDVRRLMNGVLLLRAVFDSLGQTGWIRVRTGDLDLDGKTIIKMTYKRVDVSDTGAVERVIDTVVDSYDSCVELLQEAGLKLRSRQESKRVKYICTHLGERYIVNIDMWPLLDDIVCVGITPVDGMNPEDLEDLCESLNLTRLGGEEYLGGVDDLYKKRLGFKPVLDGRDVRFNMTSPSSTRPG